MTKLVEGYGPLDAPLLWIGEAPGKEEVAQGKPFVGETGKTVRNAIRACGLDPDTDVRYTNAIPINPGTFPAGAAGTKLLDEWAAWFWKDVARCSPKVIVACGTQALRRIADWDLNISQWHGSLMDAGLNGERVPCIPVPHPAGISRDPRRALRGVFLQEVEWACQIASGAWKKPDTRKPEIIAVRTYAELTQALAEVGKDILVLDTEYNRESYHVHTIGFAAYSRPTRVYSVQYPSPDMLALLASRWRKQPFIAHNAHAELKSMRVMGVELEGTIYDTLQMHALVSPDLPHSLSFCARTLVADCCEWKHLSGEHPVLYNALDVMYCGLVAKVLIDKLRSEGLMDSLYLARVEPHIARTLMIEQRGLLVDKRRRDQIGAELQVKSAQAAQRVIEALGAKVAQRAKDIRNQIAKLTRNRDVLVEDARALALQSRECGHTTKLRAKPKSCEECIRVFSDYLVPAITQGKQLMKPVPSLTKLATELETRGFRVGNDEDTRWYVTEIAQLKRARKTETGLVAVNIDALEALSHDPIIQDIWMVKHCEKLQSTFLDIAIDDKGYAHPPILMHGTATGRPSSGREKSEGEANDAAFNAFNIPEAMRAIYVPRDGYVFVGGDLSDMEGRIVALTTGDPKLCELYRQGVDVHGYLGCRAYGLEVNDPSEYKSAAKGYKFQVGNVEWSARDAGKRANHGRRYGMGRRKAAQILKLPLDVINILFDAYDKEFEVLLRYQQDQVERVFGKVSRYSATGAPIYDRTPARVKWTATGRRRYYLGPRAALEKEVMSQDGQSLGADVWYTVVDRLCQPRSTDLRIPGLGRFVIGTYDSFLLEVPINRVDEAAAFLKACAEEPIDFLAKLPGAKLMPASIPIEIKVGSNYAFEEKR